VEGWGDELRTEVDTTIDLEFEYKEVVLKFQVPVTGSIESGEATYWETSWSEVDIHVGLTPADVRDWVVEQFQDDGLPVPSWAYIDGQDILDEIKDKIKAHVDVG